MGKKYSRLWSEVVSLDNLLTAFRKAARGKRSKSNVAEFEYDLEGNLIELRKELCAGSYQPGPYACFVVHEAKKRLISAAPFRDRVVHHAVVNVTEPMFERKFIFDSYANRVGKGTHKALDRCTQFMRRFDYVLPMDVCQFFPSIDHQILLNTLSDTIADQNVLELCRKIIDSGQGILTEVYQMVYFPGDDLFANQRPRGLPIGNLTSQFWANVYLMGLDNFIKRQLKCKGYLRYVDDLLFFSNSKSQLHQWRSDVLDFLAGLRLTAHENRAQPRPSKTGVPFLGFQVYPAHRRLKRRNIVRARRRLKKAAQDVVDGKLRKDKLDLSVQGWANHARYGDTYGLQRAIFMELNQIFYGGQYASKTISHFQ